MSDIGLAPLDFELVRDDYPDRWERADVTKLEYREAGPGRFHVELADGEAHDVVLRRRGEQVLGRCDCDGFAFHSTAGKGPCAHLCALRKLTVLDEIHLPDVDTAGDRAAAGDGDGGGRDAAAGDITVPDRDPSEIETAEEFVEEVAGVPKAFVIQMGHGDTKTPYITKEGLNYIAHRQGLYTRAEALSPSWEEPHDMAAWRGIVRDQAGREWIDVGTAWAEHEDMQGAESNLDELASTRATNRALRLATGAGLASIEELNGGATLHDPEGPPPGGIDGDSPELATDGGLAWAATPGWVGG